MYLFSVSNVSFKVIVQFLAIIIIYTVVKSYFFEPNLNVSPVYYLFLKLILPQLENRLKTIMFTTSDTVMKCFLL